MWDISEYCISVPNDQKPVCTPPTNTTVWHGHLSSVVSIDIAEVKGLLITASTDCSVRIWTIQGRYIGTYITTNTIESAENLGSVVVLQAPNRKYKSHP